MRQFLGAAGIFHLLVSETSSRCLSCWMRASCNSSTRFQFRHLHPRQLSQPKLLSRFSAGKPLIVFGSEIRMLLNRIPDSADPDYFVFWLFEFFPRKSLYFVHMLNCEIIGWRWKYLLFLSEKSDNWRIRITIKHLQVNFVPYCVGINAIFWAVGHC